MRYALEREEEWTNTALLLRALEEFYEVEAAVLERFNDVVDRAHEGEIADVDFARIVESELLPTWRSAREGLDRVDDEKLVEGLQKLCNATGEYARSREAAFVVMGQALREGDLAEMERGGDLMQDADRIVEQLISDMQDGGTADVAAGAAETPP